MVSLGSVYFGIRLWIWLYLFGSLFGLVFIIIWFNRERIRGAYYRLRWPEKTLKVIMHYKSGFYKIYWRLIPDNELFKVDKKAYLYDESQVRKEDDFYIAREKQKSPMLLIVESMLTTTTKKGKELIHIGDTKEYEFNKLFCIQQKGKKYAEIHYIFNYPYPINFDVSKAELKFSAESLAKFQEADLLTKLLKMKFEKNFLIFILMVVVFNVLLTLFLVAKMMGWIK